MSVAPFITIFLHLHQFPLSTHKITHLTSHNINFDLINIFTHLWKKNYVKTFLNITSHLKISTNVHTFFEKRKKKCHNIAIIVKSSIYDSILKIFTLAWHFHSSSFPFSSLVVWPSIRAKKILFTLASDYF